MRPTLRGVPAVLFQNFNDLSLKQSSRPQLQSQQQAQKQQLASSNNNVSSNLKEASSAKTSTGKQPPQQQQHLVNKSSINGFKSSRKNLNELINKEAQQQPPPTTQPSQTADTTTPSQGNTTTANGKIKNEFIGQRSVSGLIPKVATTTSVKSSGIQHQSQPLQTKQLQNKSQPNENIAETPKSTLKMRSVC